MKLIKIAMLTLLASIMVFTTANAVDVMPAGVIQGGIFRTNATTLTVKIKPTITILPSAPPLVAAYSGGSFTVRFPNSYGAVSLAISGSYHYGEFPYSPMSMVVGDSTYYVFSFGNPFSNLIPSPSGWPANNEISIATLTISGGTVPANADFRLTNGPIADLVAGGTGFSWYQEVSGNDLDANPLGSQGIFYHASALPIELTNFTARAQPDHTVALDWETATEINFSHYEVEHSADGVKYNQIGKVIGNGTQNGPEVYGFIHDRPVDSDNYYRLRNVDNDGAFSYSPVRIVRFGKENDHFTLSPNPTAGPFSLISTKLDHYKDDLRYQIFDVTGKLIEEGLVKDERLDFDLSKYKSGMYSFAILSNKEFIKQFQLILTTH